MIVLIIVTVWLCSWLWQWYRSSFCVFLFWLSFDHKNDFDHRNDFDQRNDFDPKNYDSDPAFVSLLCDCNPWKPHYPILRNCKCIIIVIIIIIIIIIITITSIIIIIITMFNTIWKLILLNLARHHGNLLDSKRGFVFGKYGGWYCPNWSLAEAPAYAFSTQKSFFVIYALW